MKLTITTLVIIEGSYIQGIFHSLEEHPGKAYQELVDQVENEYGYDADKDHVPLHFKTIQDIENYFELVHIETQELTSTGFKTAIFKMNNMEPIITVNEYPIGWEPKEEDLEEIISHTPYFDIHVDDAIYEVLNAKRKNNYLKQ